MRIPAVSRAPMLARAVVLTLVAGLAQAQATAPQVPPVPPAQPDPRPPAAQAAVAPPAAAIPAATPPAPMPAPRPAAPPDSTPPAAAANQAAELARGDPARWSKEDASEEQRMRTERKEIAAAFEEAKIACRSVEIVVRTQCMKDARATYAKEMAALKSGAGAR